MSRETELLEMKVGDAIAEVVALGIPRGEADELYASVICGATSAAFLDRDKPIAPVVRDRLMLAAERRAAHWPHAYAAGRANFRGHWLSVDQRVLIPRPETEGLVDLVVTFLRSYFPTPLIADIGTGSGAIAISLALETSVAGIIATDISADALNVALENATALGAKERINFRKGDLLAPLLDDTVDIVVSNPPYVATGEWDALESGVKDYEPRLALDGGPDGMAVIGRLVREAHAALNPGGLIALEVDARRADEAARLTSMADFEGVEVRIDTFGRPRYVLGRRSEQR